MDPILLSIAVILLILCLPGFYFLYRIPYCSVISEICPVVTVSIIIPARNEEHNLPRLLESIKCQPCEPHEIIIVNDHSEDGTKEIALQHGAQVIDSEALPHGWTGKNWACHQGARAARGDHLLFLDADTFFEENGLRKLLDAYICQEGVLSVGPYHCTRKFYEEFSSFFNIAMMGGMNAFRAFGKGKTGLFGQCMLVSREHYTRVGGHETVKNRILENFFLSRIFAAAGIPIHLYGGKGTISFRMFPNGLGELVAGWSKAFASGAGNTPLSTLLTIIIWFIGALGSFLFLLYAVFFSWSHAESGADGYAEAVISHDLFIITGAAIILCIIYACQTLWMLRRIGSFRWYTAVLFPVHLIFYNIIFARSVLLSMFGKKVRWKNRDVLGT